MKCWGLNNFGQLGQANTNNFGDGPVGETNFPPVADLGVGITPSQVSAGDAHTCALTTTGQVLCWGASDLGRLGYGNLVAFIGDDEDPDFFASILIP